MLNSSLTETAAEICPLGCALALALYGCFKRGKWLLGDRFDAVECALFGVVSFHIHNIDSDKHTNAVFIPDFVHLG